MDLFDYGQYFSRRALILSRESDLVKAAACAAAAKQLGQMRHPEMHAKARKGYGLVHRTLKSNGRDFLWCGAKYYQRAIRSMAAVIMQSSSPPIDLSSPAIIIDATSPSSVSSSSVEHNTSEARFLAACIMCSYERLSNSIRALDRHLNAIYNFVQLDKVQAPSPTGQPTESLRSLFWVFVQNDFEESCKPRWVSVPASG